MRITSCHLRRKQNRKQPVSLPCHLSHMLCRKLRASHSCHLNHMRYRMLPEHLPLRRG